MFEQRFMAGVEYNDRIVAWRFVPVEPITASELAGDTVGEVFFVSRDEPGDVWGPPVSKGMVSYDVFAMTVEPDGFTEAEIVQSTGEDFAESEAQTEAINESLARDDARQSRAVELARERYGSDDVEVEPDGFGTILALESVDGGYWVGARVWVPAEDVEA